MIVLHEFHRAAAREEGEHHVGLGGRDVGQERLEFHVGKRQAQFLDDLAARFLEAFLETADGLVAGCVFPGDGDGGLVALGVGHGAHGVGRLPVGERRAEDAGAAQRAGDGVGARVGDDQRGVAVFRGLGQRHRHARVHRADQHVNLVALDQAVGVFSGLGGVGLVIHLEVFDLAPTQLAALFGNVQLEAVFDGVAQRGVGAAIGQHETDFDLVGGLRAGGGERQGRGNRSPGQGVVHGLSPCFVMGWHKAGRV
ncbi:hypothetical protein D3C71_1380480 [compost metagenome]